MNVHLGLEKSCPPCLGVCHGNYKLFSRHTGALWSRFSASDLKGASSVCSASSNGQRRNPDFSRQSKSFSRGRGRQNQEKEIFDGMEDSDSLSSKNGPLLSLSNNPRFQATATPGQREKEIVELFRKVQAQLRERAALKEEKKIEASQQGQGERGTVDSLLKLLRKHSVDQGKKHSSSEEANVDHSERSNSFEEEPNSSFFETDSFTTPEDDAHDPIPVATRPVSNFQRRSPVPRIKYQPVYSAEENAAIDSLSVSTRTRKNKIKKETAISEPTVEPIFFDEAEDEFDDEPSSPSDLDEVEEEITEQPNTENFDLSSMKLSELRELAKSRGMKGYSKLKKVELVKLLGDNGT